MPEYRNAGKKVSPASVFRHQGQSGTAGYGLVWHCPAMLLTKKLTRLASWYMGLLAPSACRLTAASLFSYGK
jgi:hypothetical protein